MISLEIAKNIIDLEKAWEEYSRDEVKSKILRKGDTFNKEAQEVKTELHELCKSKTLYIIKHQHFNPQYHLNQNKLRLNCKCTNIIEVNFKKCFNY